MTNTLNRETFVTSRAMDFFTESDLVKQTGHELSEWPLVFLKEAIDNALDACEEHDVAPAVTVVANATGITVADNGPGLPDRTLEAALDFTIRASNREAYVAPDRGAQGNALMTLAAMPFVLDPDAGKLVVSANGMRHEITCGADPVTQKPVIRDDTKANGKRGTSIGLRWGKRVVGDVDVWPFNEFEDPTYKARRSTRQSEIRLCDCCRATRSSTLTLRCAWSGLER
jgi:hypothetical protein